MFRRGVADAPDESCRCPPQGSPVGNGARTDSGTTGRVNTSAVKGGQGGVELGGVTGGEGVDVELTAISGGSC